MIGGIHETLKQVDQRAEGVYDGHVPLDGWGSIHELGELPRQLRLNKMLVTMASWMSFIADLELGTISLIPRSG